MTKVMELQSKDHYLNKYRARYPEWGGQTEPSELMVTDVSAWLDRWPGFHTFLEVLTDEGLFGEMAITDLQEAMALSPKGTWETGILEHLASLLAWYAMEVAFLMDVLEECRDENVGSKDSETLQRNQSYVDRMDQFHQGPEQERLFSFYQGHPGLYECAYELFMNILLSVMLDEGIYPKYMEILNLENKGDDLHTLKALFREQVYESIIGQMLIWIGFYHYLQQHKGDGER